MANESNLSTSGPPFTYSIFTTPLAKQTAERFGMTVTKSNRQRRYSSSSLNAIKANLYVTPKKTTQRQNILNDGSKSVNYINKMDYNMTTTDLVTMNNDNDTSNKENDISSPSNRKNVEKATDNISKD